jgi:hypothetical protein
MNLDIIEIDEWSVVEWVKTNACVEGTQVGLGVASRTSKNEKKCPSDAKSDA